MKGGIYRAFATVGSWTMLSRLLGFLRELLLSRAIGASGSPIADAFVTAFQIPNMFRRFLAEGAFNAGFVPMFAKKMENEEEAREFAQNAFSGLATINLFLILLVQIFTPAFIALLSSGFIGDARFEIAISYTHITIFYILFMSLGALLSGILNSYDRWWEAAAAPVLLNVVMVSLLFAMLFVELEPITRGLWLSWGIFLSGVLQFGFLFRSVRRLGLKLSLRLPKWNSNMKALAVVILPAMLAKGVAQINLVVGSQIASFDAGGKSWMYYAERFYQLPVGIIGVAIGVVLLPAMSKLIKKEEAGAVQARFNESVQFAMLLTLPAMAVFLAIPLPLVRTLFEGGMFMPADSAATSFALLVLALGLPAVVLQQVLFPLFFARDNTKTPAKFAVYSAIINLIVAVSLFKSQGYLAAAWSTVVSSWALVFFLWFASLKTSNDSRLSKVTIKLLAIFVFASALTGALGYLITGHLVPEPWWQDTRKWLAMGLTTFALMAFYFALVMVMAKLKPRDLKKLALR